MMHESVHLAVGKEYKCRDIFEASNPVTQHFYYVEAGWDVQRHQKMFNMYKKKFKEHFFEVYGFKNLDYPKMEYRFNYLFRIEAPKEPLEILMTDFEYSAGIHRIPYTKREIIVPEDNDEALDDMMQCDFFLPGLNIKPKTREHFADIMSGL